MFYVTQLKEEYRKDFIKSLDFRKTLCWTLAFIAITVLTQLICYYTNNLVAIVGIMLCMFWITQGVIFTFYNDRWLKVLLPYSCKCGDVHSTCIVHCTVILSLIFAIIGILLSNVILITMCLTIICNAIVFIYIFYEKIIKYDLNYFKNIY